MKAKSRIPFNKGKKLVAGEYYDKNYRIHTIFALGFSFFLCGISYSTGLLLDSNQSDLLSPIPEAYAFESYTPERSTTESATVFTEELNDAPSTAVSIDHIPEERLEIVAYIREVFGKDADRALLLLIGDGKHKTCRNGENHNLNPEAVNINRNGSEDYGVFQLNNAYHGGKENFDWKLNIDKAYAIYERQGFRPWTCSVILGEENYLGLTE